MCNWASPCVLAVVLYTLDQISRHVVYKSYRYIFVFEKNNHRRRKNRKLFTFLDGDIGYQSLAYHGVLIYLFLAKRQYFFCFNWQKYDNFLIYLIISGNKFLCYHFRGLCRWLVWFFLNTRKVIISCLKHKNFRNFLSEYRRTAFLSLGKTPRTYYKKNYIKFE